MRTTQSSSAARVAGAPSSSSSRRVTPCCSKVGLKRGPWTPEEDKLLIDYISKEGEGRWRTMPKKAGLLRCGKSCRLRWMNYLRPTVKRGHISPDEEDLILRLHRLLGNRWSLIAGRIPGRTDNEIKNYWNTHLTKKLISQGIDPKTHKPLENPSDDNTENNQTSSSAPIQPVAAFPVPPTNEEQVNVVEEQVNLQDNNGEGTNQYNNNNGGHGTGNQMNVEAGGIISMGDNNDEDIEMDFCTDEVFFSFFDSLMNDDTFTTATATATAAAQNTENMVVPSSSEKPSVPSNQMSFPFSTAGWDDNDQFLP